jgi:hypothetical protein
MIGRAESQLYSSRQANLQSEKQQAYLHIVMEYAENGDLYQVSRG